MSADASALRFEALRRGLPRLSPRAWRFAVLARASRAGALLSEGLRIGHAHGFDSGPFMAHVYADEARGRGAIGRAMDRRLLDRPTCQAFRDIRALAERAVLEAIDETQALRPGGPVVADLAAGPSPYLLQALRRRPQARAVLCDVDPAALDQAGAAARALGVADRVTLRRSDAFDATSLASLDAPIDVVCELGLYGIYHDDGLIEDHLTTLMRTLRPAQLVCNVQVANPEIEYIARVWRNSEGERCVWRLRSAEQIVGYARAAGWEPTSITADRHGIYRVLRLERRAEEQAA
jgi:hypothetical protein